MFEEVI